MSATPSEVARVSPPRAVTGERRALTGTALERTRAVVDEVLARASKDGERAVGWARLILASIIVLAWPLSTYDEMKNGEISDWMVVGCSAAAVAFSLWVLRFTRTHSVSPTMRTISICIDAVLVLGIIGSFVLKPPPTSYFGIGRISGIGVAYFAVLGAGLRLTRRGAVTAVIIFALGVAGLMVLDETRNHIGDTVANRVTIAALLLNGGVFAWLIATRTRTLVLEGAAQSLMAERARARLGAYVSEEVAAHALASDEVRMGGKRQEVAVLFSDLRSFTSASEKADPEDIVRELNEYFELMVGAVQQHGGVVDKYIGDSIMAVFGAPIRRDDDAARAVKAAAQMEKNLVTLNNSREKRGLQPLRHGIGVHTGPVIAGNIGTISRASYTVIGDTVNVAARLESCTKDVGVSVLVSDAVVAKVTGVVDVPALKAMGDVKAKGRDEKIAVFTLA